jgi:hypothetical protein
MNLIIMIIINMLMPANLIVLRALLALLDRSILARLTTVASLGIIRPTEVNQIEKEALKGGIRC